MACHNQAKSPRKSRNFPVGKTKTQTSPFLMVYTHKNGDDLGMVYSWF